MSTKKLMYFTIIHLLSLYPEIYDFRMKHSAISSQQSAKTVDIMRFLLKVESYTLIALILKCPFPDEHYLGFNRRIDNAK